MAVLNQQRNQLAAVLNWLTPKGGMHTYSNIAYADAVRNCLDVYKPKDCTTGLLLPVLMFVHGGSWNKGDKADYVFLAQALTSIGFVVVIINYRLAPEVQFPAYVDDTAQALGWVYQRIGEYGGDASNIMLMGHSAGAFNVMEMLVQPHYLQMVAVPRQVIKCVVAIAGPYCYDFSVDPTAYAFPTQSTMQEVMPALHVSVEDIAPVYLLVAQNDTLVKPSNAQAMEAALLAINASVMVIEVPKVTHVSIIAAFAKRCRFLGDTWGVFNRIISAHR